MLSFSDAFIPIHFESLNASSQSYTQISLSPWALMMFHSWYQLCSISRIQIVFVQRKNDLGCSSFTFDCAWSNLYDEYVFVRSWSYVWKMRGEKIRKIISGSIFSTPKTYGRFWAKRTRFVSSYSFKRSGECEHIPASRQFRLQNSFLQEREGEHSTSIFVKMIGSFLVTRF